MASLSCATARLQVSAGLCLGGKGFGALVGILEFLGIDPCFLNGE
jgi:hypothetical protein